MKGLPRDVAGVVLAVLALANLVAAVWALVTPVHWYANFPARVPDFGPANVHFVRDVGVSLLVMAVATAWAALRPSVRPPLVAMATLFFTLHALVHAFDTARGLVDARHWWIDLPTTYLPALLLLLITVSLRSGQRRR